MVGVYGAWRGANADSLEAVLASLLWVAGGAALARLYPPALRLFSFGLLLFAGVFTLGALSPFAAMEIAPAVRERPDFVTLQVARSLAVSVLCVVFAYMVSRARRAILAARQAAAARAPR